MPCAIAAWFVKLGAVDFLGRWNWHGEINSTHDDNKSKKQQALFKIHDDVCSGILNHDEPSCFGFLFSQCSLKFTPSRTTALDLKRKVMRNLNTSHCQLPIDFPFPRNIFNPSEKQWRLFRLLSPFVKIWRYQPKNRHNINAWNFSHRSVTLIKVQPTSCT